MNAVEQLGTLERLQADRALDGLLDTGESAATAHSCFDDDGLRVDRVGIADWLVRKHGSELR